MDITTLGSGRRMPRAWCHNPAERWIIPACNIHQHQANALQWVILNHLHCTIAPFSTSTNTKQMHCAGSSCRFCQSNIQKTSKKHPKHHPKQHQKQSKATFKATPTNTRQMPRTGSSCRFCQSNQAGQKLCQL